MSEQNIQEQINILNQKMDLVLDVVLQQQQKTESVADLFSDLQIVGKDMYDTAVVELDNHKVELDLDQVKTLGIQLLQNIENIRVMVSLFESGVDFAKDAGPLVTESIIDFTKKLHQFEQKGYFEFFKEAGRIIDNVVTNFSKDDVAHLADNIVVILNTVKDLTQPEMMNGLGNALKVYNSMEMESAPEYSIFRVMKEINKPEMKRAMGFMITFMNNLSDSK